MRTYFLPICFLIVFTLLTGAGLATSRTLWSGGLAVDAVSQDEDQRLL